MIESPQPPRRTQGINVLLVEDNPDDAFLLRESLRDAGATEFKLTHVETLRDGLAHASRGDTEVVLLDLFLPDAAGLDTVTRVLAGVPDLPVVVLTGLDDSTLGTKALQAGAQDYLVKEGFDGRLLSRCLHYAIERHRLRQQALEDTAVSSALARVGQELISAISTPVLVDRLCRLTTEVLDCDFTQTWLWNSGEEAYVPVAHHGDTPEIWEAVRDLKVPRAMIGDLLAATAQTGVLISVIGEPLHVIPPSLTAGQHEVTTLLYMIIRRGTEVVGGQASGYRGRSVSFTSRQERIAKGLVTLAALGFENTRLVEELERTSLIKTYFAATMSHELRGAVGTMLLGTEDVLDDIGDSVSPETRQNLEIARKMARESVDLIDATLEMHGSESRHSEPRRIDVGEFIGQIAQETSLSWRSRNTDFSWYVPDVPALRSDPVKLKMIIRNLVGNAIKFTDGGKVRLEASAANEGVQFSISDTGVGIAAEELPTIFEPFRQGHGARSRRVGSAGLGLFIVRRLVDMLDGSIRVESEQGRGSAFHVWIPLEPKPRQGGS